MIVLSACALVAGLLASGPAADASKPVNNEAQLPARSADNAATVDAQMLQPMEYEDLNGRLWVGRPIIGGMESPVRDHRQDGAARYGAYGEGGGTIVVEMPGLFQFESQRLAEVRPFERVTDKVDSGNPYTNPYSRARQKLVQRLEDARQQWLKDNNYVGGVRTFVNDAALLKPAERKTGDASGLPAPRGVIELAPDAPRFKSRMRVQAEPAKAPPAPSRRAAAGVIKVLPKDPPKEAATDVKSAAAEDAGATKSNG